MSRITRTGRLFTNKLRGLAADNELVQRVFKQVRESSTARRAMARIFDNPTPNLASTSFLNAGNVLDGTGLDNLPIVIVSLVETTENAITGLLEDVAREQLLTAGFRPVIVIAGNYFRQVRSFGYPVEHIVPQADWTYSIPWETYLTTRIRQIREYYGAHYYVDLAGNRDSALTLLGSL